MIQTWIQLWEQCQVVNKTTQLDAQISPRLLVSANGLPDVPLGVQSQSDVRKWWMKSPDMAKKKYGKWGFKPPEGVFPTCSNKPLQLGTASRSHERRCWRSSLTILLMGEVPQDWVEKILGKCCGSENHSEYHQLKLSHLTIVKLSHLTIAKLSHHYFDICQAKSFNHSEYR